MSAPVPVIGWDATDDEWRAQRVGRCGASDVAALLGFDHYRSPWQVWAEKTGDPRAVASDESEASRLGLELEPWLLQQAATLIGDVHVERTYARSYAHPEHPWRTCSPDGEAHPTTESSPHGRPWHEWEIHHGHLVQCKTAGLLSGRAPGWTADAVPLGYELQARWEMHVMNAHTNTIMALVAGLGLRAYPIQRDLGLEDELVTAVDEWWQRHIINKEEPALTGRDSAVIAALYPHVARAAVDLDATTALELWGLYRQFRDQEKEAAAAKNTVGTQLKAMLGDAETGLVDGQPLVTWGQRRGRIDWETIARELYGLLTDAAGALLLPKLDELTEQFRGTPTRALTIKE